MSYKRVDIIPEECQFCSFEATETFKFSHIGKKVNVHVCNKHGKQLFLKSYKELRELFK